MEQGTWFFILKLLPYVAICSIIAFLLGLFFGRPKAEKSAAVVAAKSSTDDTARLKKLQEKLQNSENDARSLRQQMESLKTDTIAKLQYTKVENELQAVSEKLNAETKRAAVLEADVRKAQDTSASLNARLNSDAKTQNSRLIALENELSKAREAVLLAGAGTIEADPELRLELDRAKETVANAMRLVGETRKREAALQLELDSCKKRLESGIEARTPQLLSSLPFQARAASSPAPSAAADRAREEVARLNAKRDGDLATRTSSFIALEELPAVAEELPAATEELSAATEELPAAAEELSAAAEEPSAAAEELPAAAEELPAAAEELSAATEELSAATEELPAATEELPAVAEEPSAATKELPAAAEEKVTDS